jgi:pimeloyl-ACP methyl ester carboxylesterase
LDSLGAQQVVLVGQSMGGSISQYLYLTHPERVLAMVMIGAISIAFPYSRWDIALVKASLPLMALWPYGHFKRTLAKTTAVKPDVQAYALATVSKLTQREFLRIWKGVTLSINQKGLPGHYIRVPLLLTHGEHDATGAIRRDAPKWAAYEPDVEYVVISDAGHNANQDNPQLFNQLLLKFLQARLSGKFASVG